MDMKKTLTISLVSGILITIAIILFAGYSESVAPGLFGDKFSDPLYYGIVFITNSVMIFIFLALFTSLKSEKGREVKKQSGASMAIRILIIPFVWLSLLLVSGMYGSQIAGRMTFLHMAVLVISLIFSTIKIWRWNR